MLIETKLSPEIIKFLERDLPVTASCIGIIENKPGDRIYVDDEKDPKGVFVLRELYSYIYTKEGSFIDEVVDIFLKEGQHAFGSVEESVALKIQNKLNVKWTNSCTQYYLTVDRLDLSLIKNPVRSADIKDIDTIYKYDKYQAPEEYEEIFDSIKNRPSSAIYINDEIVCWILVHEDNHLGFMYTKEEYRRKGFAVDVTIDIASKLIEKGKIPTLLIESVNNMSPGLARKCGFVECGKFQWFAVTADNI